MVRWVSIISTGQGFSYESGSYWALVAVISLALMVFVIGYWMFSARRCRGAEANLSTGPRRRHLLVFCVAVLCCSIAASLRFASFDEAIDMFVNAARLLNSNDGDEGQDNFEGDVDRVSATLAAYDKYEGAVKFVLLLPVMFSLLASCVGCVGNLFNASVVAFVWCKKFAFISIAIMVPVSSFLLAFALALSDFCVDLESGSLDFAQDETTASILEMYICGDAAQDIISYWVWLLVITVMLGYVAVISASHIKGASGDQRPLFADQHERSEISRGQGMGKRRDRHRIREQWT